MISRLTAFATLFAVLSTASLAIAAETFHARSAAEAAPVVTLERVIVTGKR